MRSDLYANRPKPSHTENLRLARLARQGDAKALKMLVEANAGLAYNNALRYEAMNNKGNSIVSSDDLLQAAFLGLTEAAHKYNPELGHRFVTYAHWWVNKRLSEEVKKSHWCTVRPPETMVHKYFSLGRMSDDERGVYEVSFMRFAEVTDENGGELDDSRHYLVNDILRAMAEVDLSIEEELTFIWLHEPDSPPLSHRDVAEILETDVKTVKQHEASAFEKIRQCLGLK